MDAAFSRRSQPHTCTLYSTALLRPPACVAACAGFVFTPVYAPLQEAGGEEGDSGGDGGVGGRLRALSLLAQAQRDTPYGVAIHMHAATSSATQLFGNEALAAAIAAAQESDNGAAAGANSEELIQPPWCIGGHEQPVQALAAVQIRRRRDGGADDEEDDGADDDGDEEWISDVLLVSSSPDRLVFWMLSDILACVSSDPPRQPHGRALPAAYNVHRMELDESGSRLALCLNGGGGVVILDVESGAVEAVLEGHAGRVNGASFVPASYLAEHPSAAGMPVPSASAILTYGQDRTFKLWDLCARRLLYTSAIVSSSPFLTHTWDEAGVAGANARQARFVLGSEDGKLRHYEMSKVVPHLVAAVQQMQSGGAAAMPAALHPASVRLIHTLDVSRMQRKLCALHDSKTDDLRRAAAHAAQQGKVIRASPSPSPSGSPSSGGTAAEALYRPYMATEANMPGGGGGSPDDEGEDAAAQRQDEDAPAAILAMFYPKHVNARGAEGDAMASWAPPTALAAAVAASSSAAALPARSPSASPTRSPTGSPVPSASPTTSANASAGALLSSTSDTLYVVTTRGVLRVNSRTYEVEWSGSFVATSPGGVGGSSDEEMHGVIAAPSTVVANLTPLSAVGLSAHACFLEAEELDALTPALELFLVLSSPFLPRMTLLKLLLPLTAREELLAASLPSVYPAPGPLPAKSCLRQWQWPVAAPTGSTAGRKKAPATKRSAKPGQVGAPTSHNLVFHTRIKSSGYGPAPTAAGAKGPRQLNLGGLHQKANSTAGRQFQAQQRKGSAGSSAASSASAASEKRYPLDAGPINVLSPFNPPSSKSPPLHNGPIIHASFSSDAKRLLTASLDSTACATRCPPWKHPQGSSHLLGHKKPLRCAAWAWTKPNATANGKESDVMMLTSSSDATARLWQLGRADPLLVFDHLKRNESSVGAPAASSSAAAAAAAAAASDNPAFSSDIVACSFFRQNQLVLLAHRNALLVYRYFIDPAKTNTDLKKLQNLNKYKLLLSSPVSGSQSLSTFACVNSFMSTLVLLADSARGLHWLDLSSGQLVRSVADAHSKPVHCVTMNPPSAFVPEAGESALDTHQLFATVAADSAVKLWDVRSKECARRITGHVNRSAPVRAAFSPCSRYLAAGSEDNRAYVFDLRTGNILDKLAGATDVVCDVAYNPLHPQLVTAGYDGRIRFYTTS